MTEQDDYLILVTPEMGCAYRWSREYNDLEYCPLNTDGTLTEAWGPIDKDIVEDEPVTFRELEVTLKQVYPYVEKKLGVNHETVKG